MDGLKVGYARVSTVEQDLSVQRSALQGLEVPTERIYVDHGLTGTNRDRPGLAQAMAACRAGDTLVVTKLDRLARSVSDARDIVDELTRRGVVLNIGGSVHDPADPVGRLLFNVLALVAEFEADLIRTRTREGMAAARAAGRLRGRKPKLSPHQEEHLVELHASGGEDSVGAGRAVWRDSLHRLSLRSAHSGFSEADKKASYRNRGRPLGSMTRSPELPSYRVTVRCAPGHE